MSDFERIEEHRELVTGLEYEDWRDQLTDESEASDSSDDEADGTDASELEEAA